MNLQHISDQELLSRTRDLACLAKPKTTPEKSTAAETPFSRAIPAELKKSIWRRDQGKCTGCGSHFALEIDHTIPVAMGGESTPGNLKLLCRQCNQRAAIKQFGVDKMQIYLD